MGWVCGGGDIVGVDRRDIRDEIGLGRVLGDADRRDEIRSLGSVREGILRAAVTKFVVAKLVTESTSSLENAGREDQIVRLLIKLVYCERAVKCCKLEMTRLMISVM